MYQDMMNISVSLSACFDFLWATEHHRCGIIDQMELMIFFFCVIFATEAL